MVVRVMSCFIHDVQNSLRRLTQWSTLLTYFNNIMKKIQDEFRFRIIRCVGCVLFLFICVLFGPFEFITYYPNEKRN